MKKIALLFAVLSLFVATVGCRNEEPATEYTLRGVWQPIKKVVTTVEKGEDPVTDIIIYNECERESRWRFNTETLGKRTEWNDTTVSGQCTISSDRNFSYEYNNKEKTIKIKYQGNPEPDNGRIVTLDDETLNLIIETTSEDKTKYHSVTYTFRKMLSQ